MSLEVATTLFNQLPNPNEVSKRSRRSTGGRARRINLVSSCPILPSPDRGVKEEIGLKEGRTRKEEEKRD